MSWQPSLYSSGMAALLFLRWFHGPKEQEQVGIIDIGEPLGVPRLEPEPVTTQDQLTVLLIEAASPVFHDLHGLLCLCFDPVAVIPDTVMYDDLQVCLVLIVLPEIVEEMFADQCPPLRWLPVVERKRELGVEPGAPAPPESLAAAATQAGACVESISWLSTSYITPETSFRRVAIAEVMPKGRHALGNLPF